MTAAVVALLGILGSKYLNEKQAIETNVRLYTELMSKREESESALRKDMFASIIDTFLKPHLNGQAPSLDTNVLNLELLAYNFHESLNLKPLFAHVNQMLVLEGAGKKFERKFHLDRVPRSKGGLPVELEEEVLTLDGIEREFRIYVMEVNHDTQEIRLRLEVITPENSGRFTTNSAEFWVGFEDNRANITVSPAPMRA
ncbi:MAG: hypothetical protein C4293_13335 [Nitrospiraceae bacterium]